MSTEPTGSDFTYTLPYSELQEIHALVGEVCGSHMNLPVRMIVKAKQVHSMMLNLKSIHPKGSLHPVGSATDRELLDELVRRNNDRLERMNPTWAKHWTLRDLLYDAGKIIAGWDGQVDNSQSHT